MCEVGGGTGVVRSMGGTGTGAVSSMYWRDWSDYECVRWGGGYWRCEEYGGDGYWSCEEYGGDWYWRCEQYVLERLERL